MRHLFFSNHFEGTCAEVCSKQDRPQGRRLQAVRVVLRTSCRTCAPGFTGMAKMHSSEKTSTNSWCQVAADLLHISHTQCETRLTSPNYKAISLSCEHIGRIVTIVVLSPDSRPVKLAASAIRIAHPHKGILPCPLSCFLARLVRSRGDFRTRN